MDCIPLLNHYFLLLFCYLYFQALLPGQLHPSLTSTTTTQETTSEDNLTSITNQFNDNGGATMPAKNDNRVEYTDIIY